MSKAAPAPAPAPAPAASAPPEKYGKAAMVDLEEAIDFSACEVLNSKQTLERIMQSGVRDQDDLLLESDADEQLLLTIAFKGMVKIESLQLTAPGDGRAPKELKLIINRRTIDFSDAEALAGEQVLEIAEDKLGERIELNFVKFQRVERLSVFISSNQGDEETSALSMLKLFGAPIFTTNLADFKRVSGEKGE